MTLTSYIKEFLFRVKKNTLGKAHKIKRSIYRLFLTKQNITSENCFDVPIIINNRNRYSYLKQMIEQLQQFGYKNIYILDNDSTYPPLLDYYKVTTATVIYLKRNMGYMALWLNETFNQFKNKYYVYSDPDIIMQDSCPKDFVYKLYEALSKATYKEKAGVALKINDLPEWYNLKNEVISWEKGNWENEIYKDVYDAMVDTTLALYKPLSFGNAEECSAIRVAGKITAFHLPWYINSTQISAEEMYYKEHVLSTSSYWSSK